MKILFLVCFLALLSHAEGQTPRTFGRIKTANTKSNTSVQIATVTNNPYVKMNFKLPFSDMEKEYWVQKVGHFYILNGDIIVGSDLPKTMSYAMNTHDFRWGNATIPLVIDPSIYSNNLGDLVHAAINEFNRRTELCIVPRTTESDYVKIVFSSSLPTGAAGSSKVGRQGGEQQLLLNTSASTGTVIHEMMHAAGFYHEQSRDDRDSFVRIRTENLLPNAQNNFQIEPGARVGTYDYCSIMHYSTTAFTNNSQPTIECIQNGMTVPCQACVGQRTALTQTDIQGIDAFYNNVSRFPCLTNFPRPPEPPRFATVTISESDKAMQSFRHRAEVATKEGFVGAFPNFHEAQRGIDIVGGTIFLKNTVAIWQDVPLVDLSNPPLNDFAARMRATAAYATRNGFVGGFPNFFHADYGKGIVCGTMLLSNAAAEWRDVPFSELGNPSLDDIGARMRSANDYAVRNGYLGGFPNFFHANYGKGIVCGIILIKKEAGEWRDVVIAAGPR